MKKVFGYTRVSTLRQGKGVSLDEQQSAIADYALANNLQVIQWFEERLTARKEGRPKFSSMIELLREGKAEGVIMHKVDRSARNIQDWAEVSKLKDSGIEVYFAHDNVKLDSRSNRLLADMLAVVAADYSRNLSDEAIKGLKGRLRQGIYPGKAPYGYTRNETSGLCEIDPILGLLVREAFQKYATGNYTINRLRNEMFAKGLTNCNGNLISKDSFKRMLTNSFYLGVLRFGSFKKNYRGKHTPLISTEVFENVQYTLNNTRGKSKYSKHDHLFRSLIYCDACNRILTGEVQKGNTYYRCHNKKCKGICITEKKLEFLIKYILRGIKLPIEIIEIVKDELEIRSQIQPNKERAEKEEVSCDIQQKKRMLEKLNLKYLEDAFDLDTYTSLKSEIEESLIKLEKRNELFILKSREHDKKCAKFELLENIDRLYLNAKKSEKREIIQNIFSNLSVKKKNPLVKLKSQYWTILASQNVISSWDEGACFRTIDQDTKIKSKRIVSKKDKEIVKNIIGNLNFGKDNAEECGSKVPTS